MFIGDFSYMKFYKSFVCGFYIKINETAPTFLWDDVSSYMQTIFIGDSGYLKWFIWCFHNMLNETTNFCGMILVGYMQTSCVGQLNKHCLHTHKHDYYAMQIFLIWKSTADLVSFVKYAQPRTRNRQEDAFLRIATSANNLSVALRRKFGLICSFILHWSAKRRICISWFGNNKS